MFFLPDKLVYFYTKNEKKPIFGLSCDYNIGHYLDFLPDNLIVFETWSKKCSKKSIYPKIAWGIGEVGILSRDHREIASPPPCVFKIIWHKSKKKDRYFRLIC